jgi:hypothetical protein
MTKFEYGGEIVWRPTPELIAQSTGQSEAAGHGLVMQRTSSG